MSTPKPIHDPISQPPSERIEVKKTELSDMELDAKIKEKLLQIQNTVEEPTYDDEDITDVEPLEEEKGESPE